MRVHQPLPWGGCNPWNHCAGSHPRIAELSTLETGMPERRADGRGLWPFLPWCGQHTHVSWSWSGARSAHAVHVLGPHRTEHTRRLFEKRPKALVLWPGCYLTVPPRAPAWGLHTLW